MLVKAILTKSILLNNTEQCWDIFFNPGDIIQKSGAWYSYGGVKIAQGREAAKIFLQDNPEVALEIEAKIKAKITGKEEEKETKTPKENLVES